MTADQAPWSQEEDAILIQGIRSRMTAKDLRPQLPGRTVRAMTRRARVLADRGEL